MIFSESLCIVQHCYVPFFVREVHSKMPVPDFPFPVNDAMC